MLALVRSVDHNMDNLKALKFYVRCDIMFDAIAILILTTGLLLINQNHQETKCEGGEDRAGVPGMSGPLGLARVRRMWKDAAMVRISILNFKK